MLETEPPRLVESLTPHRYAAGYHDHVGFPVVSSRHGFSGARHIVAGLRPALERGASGLGQSVDAAFGAIEPAINIVKQDLSGIRKALAQIAHALRSVRQRGGAGESLLPVRRHDRRPRRAAHRGIADA